MNKVELIEEVAVTAHLTKKDAAAAVDALIGAIEKALIDGEEVKLSGFGTLVVKERAARKGVNPSTGDVIEIPAANAIVFKASKTLKDKVN